MKFFRCNYFTWQIPDHIQVWWNGDEPDWLALSTTTGIEAIFNVTTGSLAQKTTIENQFVMMVAKMNGYLAPMDEDYPDDIGLLVENGSLQISQHHLFRYGEGYALHIMLEGDFNEHDVEIFRSLLLLIEVDEESLRGAQPGKLTMSIASDVSFMSIGERRLLDIEWAHG